MLLLKKGIIPTGNITTYADAIEALSAISAVDNRSITLNTQEEIQAVGLVTNQDVLKFWTGTKEEYDALIPQDDTIYNIVDDVLATEMAGNHGSPADEETIVTNEDDTITAIGIKSNEGMLKFWTGTLAEYNNIPHDKDTLYNITDDYNSPHVNYMSNCITKITK